MNIITSIKTISITAVATFSLFLTACKKSATEIPAPAAVEKNSIAYIYKSDNTDGLAFKSLLEDNECHVTLIDRAVLKTINFSTCKLIVIDSNTDTTGTITSWTNEDTLALQATNKPMLLLGYGGLKYAQKIGNTANFGNTALWSDKGFFVSDKSSMLYKKPYIISIPTSTPAVTLYAANVWGAGQLAPAGVLNNVSLLGRFSLPAASNYYPLVSEKNRYTSFGFSKGVTDMNQTGKDFMVNLAYYSGNLEY